MSKSVQANAALQMAKKLTQGGYKSSMFLPELAEFKVWFDNEWAKGGKRLHVLHRESVNKFPQLTIPSVPSLKRYLDHHYIPPSSVMAGYSPDYIKIIEDFDAYIKLVQAAKEIWIRYEEAKAKEKLPMSRRNSESYQWLQIYLQTLNDCVNVEVKLKLRSGITLPENVTLVNNQTNITTGGQADSSDLDTAMEILEDKEKIDAWKHHIRDLAATRNTNVFGTDKPVQ